MILLLQFKDFPCYFFSIDGLPTCFHVYCALIFSVGVLIWFIWGSLQHFLFKTYFFAHPFDVLGSIKNINTGLYLTSLYPRPFVFQVKSDVRRLKGIPALVSMLDIPNKEVCFCLFSPHLSVHSLLDVCYYRWGDLGGVKERLKGCSVFLTQYQNGSLAWDKMNLRLTTNTNWKGNGNKHYVFQFSSNPVGQHLC